MYRDGLPTSGNTLATSNMDLRTGDPLATEHTCVCVQRVSFSASAESDDEMRSKPNELV